MKLSHADAPPSFQPGKPVGNIYYGACSWTDRTLIDAGTFYPGNARTAADRLAHYASQFPIVEVDATYYALPSERNAHLWVERTPPGFVFNIKAFGLFTHHPVVVERLPAAVKELLPAAKAEKSRVYLRDIPEEAEKLIWEMQAQALAPLSAAGKLGCVLFQFPHWFTARRAHIRYLEQLRDRSDWPLAVEFRGGGWMTDNYRAETLSLLEKLGLAYVVVDEPQGFRSSTPPVVALTSPLAVVRFHGHNAETWEQPNIRRRRTVPLSLHGRGAERLGRDHPRPRRTGGTGACADEQLLRRLWCPQRPATGRAAGRRDVNSACFERRLSSPAIPPARLPHSG